MDRSDEEIVMSEAEEGLPAERVARNLALHMAAAEGDLRECVALLDGDQGDDPDDDDDASKGADAWWEDESHLGWSALHFAANGGHADVVDLLLKRGALWNAGQYTKWAFADTGTNTVI